MTPEGKVKKAIREALVGMGLKRAGGDDVDNPAVGWFYMPANNGMGVSGIPDFMGIFHGRPFGVEAKGPDGAPTALQLDRMGEIDAAGGITLVIDPSNVRDLEKLLLEKLSEH